MYRIQLVVILLFTTTASANSEVYKCDYGKESHYSSSPCDQRLINLELEDLNTLEVSSEEMLIAPVYPSWAGGWRKIKMTNLDRFSEEIFAPINTTEFNNFTQVNKQILTDLPASINLQRFAISTEDILNSICTNTRFYPSPISNNKPDNILYTQYACSMRRDTQKGEFGYYKIMRSENNIYMVSVKWTVQSFIIEKGKKIIIADDKTQARKVNRAQKYLRNEVRLCNAGSCL